MYKTPLKRWRGYSSQAGRTHVFVIRISGKRGRKGAPRKFGQCTIDVLHGGGTIQTKPHKRQDGLFPNIRFWDFFRIRRRGFRRIDILLDSLLEVLDFEGRQIQIKGPKALGLPGAGSYLWPVLIRLGVCAAE